jgi:hypothetical protein
MTRAMADDERVNEADEESMPASDPPAGWSGRDPEEEIPEPDRGEVADDDVDPMEGSAPTG